MFEIETAPPTNRSAPIPKSELDRVLTAQLIVAWAGEGGEEKRLGWWRSDLISEFGGEDLFQRLLPATWQWAVLQGAREAARREDAAQRQRDYNPDRILSLFNLGFELDERIDERLQELKQLRRLPQELLPSLAQVIGSAWNQTQFEEWLAGHGSTETEPTSIGRRLRGESPSSLELLVKRFVAGLAPLGDSYPLPHYRKE